jgi:hypothetical protein
LLLASAAPQRHHRGPARDRVAGHRERHPLLRVPDHPEAWQRPHGRLDERQPRARRHQRGHGDGDGGEAEQRHGCGATQRRRQTDGHHGE